MRKAKDKHKCAHNRKLAQTFLTHKKKGVKKNEKPVSQCGQKTLVQKNVAKKKKKHVGPSQGYASSSYLKNTTDSEVDAGIILHSTNTSQ